MISCGSPGISPQILQESTPDRKMQYDYEVSQLHHIEHDVFTVFIHGFQSFSPWQGKNCSKQQPMDPLKSSAGVPFTQPVDSRCGRGLLGALYNTGHGSWRHDIFAENWTIRSCSSLVIQQFALENHNFVYVNHLSMGHFSDSKVSDQMVIHCQLMSIYLRKICGPQHHTDVDPGTSKLTKLTQAS